ncbi:DgyrCDS6176 [Dimorphilus gyrociliatus]|uniref:tRNA-dihydrouridine(47) synthase [NAD(P)(+)] n=1 Tax=Dimorphilus gyrociliatus TaxID=2664684 RepID=A0A7I8VM99_9ANNE|nr:DgyrCDS6176 [Dimorphilus gyrociliatus]
MATKTGSSTASGLAPIKEEYIDRNHVKKISQYLPSSMREEISEGNDKGGQKPKKKLKGRNKTRPIEKHLEEGKSRLCPNIIQKRECQFGEKCRFLHDPAEYWKTKPEDLPGPCYNFETFGRCPYGLTCRFAKQHTNEDLTEIQKKVEMKVEPSEKTVLSKELQITLRKKKYDFSLTDKVVAQIRKENTKEITLPAKRKLSEDGCDATIVSKPQVELENDDIAVKIRASEKKKIDFSDKTYLAPLTTVGNLPFRRVCKNYGVDITCGEMAVCTNLLQGQNSEWALVKRHASEDLFGVQICGSFPDVVGRCAQLIDEHVNCDFIDLNCGCPIDLVYRRGEGCSLIGRATRLEAITKTVTSVISKDFTIKMRTGISDGKNVAHTLIPMMEKNGVSAVTIHGRSREQRYTRSADWNYIGECVKSAENMAVFGNGDILSFEDALNFKEIANTKSLMVARGALIKPWIFTEIKESRHWDISSSERFDMLKDFTNYGLAHWGSDIRGVETTRRFMLEWLSFLYRYIPVGLLEVLPQKINERPPYYFGRNDLETLMASPNSGDWVKISEMLLGPVPSNFVFLPKHKANAYQ